MRLPRTERDQELFELVAAANRLLPAPVSRFPFNVSLHELRLQSPVWVAHLSCVGLGLSERPGGALGRCSLPVGGGPVEHRAAPIRPGGTLGRCSLPVSTGPVELWAGARSARQQQLAPKMPPLGVNGFSTYELKNYRRALEHTRGRAALRRRAARRPAWRLS
jgi:hypothetical protein